MIKFSVYFPFLFLYLKEKKTFFYKICCIIKINVAKEEFYFLMHESYYERRSTTHGLKILEMYFVNSVLDNNNWDIKYDK